MRTLFASKKCPQCGQWSAWQQRADDRCEHCRELLDPQAQQRLDEQEQVARQPLSQFMLIEIKPTDGALVRFFKYLVRGGQLAFGAIMAFLLWVITALAGQAGMLAREFRHPLLLACAAAYALVLYHRFFAHGPLPTLLTSYLADLVCLPLVLTLALVILRRWYFCRPAFVLPWAWIFSAWLVTSLWFELLLPRLRPGTATADPLDALAYALGALIFVRWLNRPA